MLLAVLLHCPLALQRLTPGFAPVVPFALLFFLVHVSSFLGGGGELP